MKKFIRIFSIIMSVIILSESCVQFVYAKGNVLLGPETGYSYLDSAVDSILNHIIDSDMSDEEKVKAIYDHFIFKYEHNTVLEPAAFDKKDSNPLQSTALSALPLLIDGYGVCDNFAAAFYVLATRAGFECNIVDGNYVNQDGTKFSHVWNQIQIEDEWFWVDVDAEGMVYRDQNLDKPLYYLYLKKDKEWKNTHEWDYSKYPATDKPEQPKAAYSVIINGSKLNLTLPILNVRGRLMYPFRECLDAMGATVSWDNKTKTAAGKLGSNTVSFTINSDIYVVNGATRQMDAGINTFINNHRTYIPLRYAAEALGFTVSWDETTQSVSLTGAVTAARTSTSNNSRTVASSDTITITPDDVPLGAPNVAPASVAASSTAASSAAPANQQSVSVYLHNSRTNKLEQLGLHTPLIQKNSTVLISCQELAEKIGAKIKYVASEDMYIIVQPINSSAYLESVTGIYINNDKVGTVLIPQENSAYTMLSYGIVAQSAPEIINGHLMIPIDAIPSAFQSNVDCYMQNNTVLVSYLGPPSGADIKRDNSFKVITGRLPDFFQ